MSAILVVAEHLRGELREVTRELVAAGGLLARQAGVPLQVAVLGAEVVALARAASLDGVDEVIQVRVREQEFDAESYARAVEALVRDRAPSVTLGAFTVNGMGYGAAVAARAGLGFASDVIECAFEDGRLVARRQFYSAKVDAELEFAQERALLLLRPTVWAPVGSSGAPLITSFDPGLDQAPVRVRHRSFVDAPAGDVDIESADIILAIGRGVGERENIGQFESLAEKLGATLASSRPLVDAGWMPSERQVGQSGKTVKPKLYLAFGISGAVQHLMGMKASGTIVAVNVDHEASIFSVAHFGAVADMFDVAEELEKLV